MWRVNNPLRDAGMRRALGSERRGKPGKSNDIAGVPEASMRVRGIHGQPLSGHLFAGLGDSFPWREPQRDQIRSTKPIGKASGLAALLLRSATAGPSRCDTVLNQHLGERVLPALSN